MIEPELRCVQFVDLATDWSEGALDDQLAARFEEHLAFCTGCGEYVVQLRQMDSVLKTLDADVAQTDARVTLVRMFRAEHDS